MRAKLNPFISSPPNINKANNTKRVVNDVTRVLPSVWLRDKSIKSIESRTLSVLKFSLILSDTTIVSLSE